MNLKHGDLVWNPLRDIYKAVAGRPVRASRMIGMVMDRPEIELPLYDGLAVWVQYLGRGGIHIALVSDLELIHAYDPAEFKPVHQDEMALTEIPDEYVRQWQARREFSLSACQAAMPVMYPITGIKITGV